MLPILFIALLIDLTLGEPPIYIHPVVYTGRISEKLIKPYAGYLYGVLIWSLSVIPVLLLFLSSLYIPTDNIFLELIKIALLSLVLKTTFSIKMLYDIVNKSKKLDENSRHLVQQIVRRDLSNASKGHVASAAIESLFESLVDGITSPLFWFLTLGIFGAMLQRLANTMDSMVGYKTKELYKEGYFSAKVDTLLNYLPARITGALMIIAGIILGLDAKGALKSLRNAKMESPNAKYPIAISAGLLGVRLEKKGYYSVGEGELPNSEKIEIALKLFKLTLTLYLAIISVIYYYLYGLSLFSYPYGLVELLKSKFVSN